MEGKDAESAPRSVEELRADHAALEAQLREREAEEKKSVLDEILKVSKSYRISLEDIITHFGGLPSRRKGTPAKPKYRDPVTGTLWSGRGKEPLWIRGKDRAFFSIEDDDSTGS